MSQIVLFLIIVASIGTLYSQRHWRHFKHFRHRGIRKSIQCGINTQLIVPCSKVRSRCAPTCLEPENAICSRKCKSGCDPLPGFVFPYNQHDQEAIPLADCIKILETPKIPDWPTNTKFGKCGDDCSQGTCENPHPYYRSCNENMCKSGCYPIKGFVYRNSPQDGVAIPMTDCESICRENTKYQECGQECPPTCASPNPKCPVGFCMAGCLPLEGFVFLNENAIEANDDAIPFSQCPPNSTTE